VDVDDGDPRRIVRVGGDDGLPSSISDGSRYRADSTLEQDSGS
jgi:hypothetical protein